MSVSDLSQDVIRQFQCLLNSLSPENLSCDGELSRSQVQIHYRQLMSKWRDLERRVGRKVSEEEIEGTYRFSSISSKVVAKVAKTMLSNLIKFKLVTMKDGSMVAEIYHTPEALAAAVRRLGGHQTGVEESTRRRVELQGQPIFNNLLGPMYDGPGTIRYEDSAAYDILSR